MQLHDAHVKKYELNQKVQIVLKLMTHPLFLGLAAQRVMAPETKTYYRKDYPQADAWSWRNHIANGILKLLGER